MVIIAKSTLKEFIRSYPDSENALDNWYDITKQNDWKNFNEIKKSFNSVDSVGNDRYIFNIKGNHYRLIALIFFKVRTVFILFIGTHKEYDLIDASRITFKN
ncbi:MAG TPA: type II toxin-antitoxin system HigB family toxin [Puia sp.]|jgi:mRNA interferase HigB|nr:type II toxin-antitoxin system HigB family toxin [Puia sp.]